MSKAKSIDEVSWEVGRIRTHCYLIERGVRAAASEVVHKSAAVEVREAIVRARLSHTEQDYGGNHIEFTIYKHDHVGMILSLLQEHFLVIPEYLRHYLCGKLYGYSEEEIGRYMCEVILQDESEFN